MPSDDVSDSALAAAASDASVAVLADLVLSPSSSPADNPVAASPVLFSSPACSVVLSVSSPISQPDSETIDPSPEPRGPPPAPPDDLLIARALKHSGKPKIKAKPIGRQPGKVDNSFIPPTRKSTKSSVVAPVGRITALPDV